MFLSLISLISEFFSISCCMFDCLYLCFCFDTFLPIFHGQSGLYYEFVSTLHVSILFYPIFYDLCMYIMRSAMNHWITLYTLYTYTVYRPIYTIINIIINYILQNISHDNSLTWISGLSSGSNKKLVKQSKNKLEIMIVTKMENVNVYESAKFFLSVDVKTSRTNIEPKSHFNLDLAKTLRRDRNEKWAPQFCSVKFKSEVTRWFARSPPSAVGTVFQSAQRVDSFQLLVLWLCFIFFQ